MSANEQKEHCILVKFKQLYDIEQMNLGARCIKNWLCPMFFPAEVGVFELLEALSQSKNIEYVEWDEPLKDQWVYRWHYHKNGYSKTKKQLVM